MNLEQQWAIAVSKYPSNTGLRKGQIYMNALFDVDEELHYELSGTEFDCFYDDSKCDVFIKRLNEHGT